MNAPRESFAVPPMTQVADTDMLEAWFAAAQHDDRMLVASGRVQPRYSLAWLMVEGWQKSAQVAVDAERDDKGGWRWIARRVVRSADGGEVAGAGRNAGERAAEPLAPDGTAVSDCILRAIKRAANFRHPAPSLATLAGIAGLKHAAGAKYYVDKLKRRGAIHIDVRVQPGGERRRFQVLDTNGHVVAETGWAR